MEGQTDDEQDEEVMEDMAGDPEADDEEDHREDNDQNAGSNSKDLERAQGAEATDGGRDDADMGDTAGQQADPPDTESKDRAAAFSARAIH